MTDRLDRAKRNGHTLLEKTKDEEEKKLIQGTLDALTEQLGLIKAWMDEKKTLVSTYLFHQLNPKYKFLQSLIQLVCCWGFAKIITTNFVVIFYYFWFNHIQAKNCLPKVLNKWFDLGGRHAGCVAEVHGSLRCSHGMGNRETSVPSWALNLNIAATSSSTTPGLLGKLCFHS